MPIITFSIGTICGVLYLVFGAAPQVLVFQSSATGLDSIIRLLTAHFVHSDVPHLLWNLCGLLILGSLLERKAGKKIYLYLGLGVISVNVYVVYFSSLTAYCGLSGVLNTLLVGVLTYYYRDPAMRPYIVLTGIASIVKLLIETHADQALFTHSAWPSVPMAHVFGFMAGLLLVSGNAFIERRLNRPNYSKYASIHQPIEERS